MVIDVLQFLTKSNYVSTLNHTIIIAKTIKHTIKRHISNASMSYINYSTHSIQWSYYY